MPNSLRLADGSYLRRSDVQNLIQLLYGLHCVEIVGFSNVGKSALMRLLAQRDIWTQELGEASRNYLPVYIDCNQMVEMSDHGFYELVLRTLLEAAPPLSDLPELQAAYATTVAPHSDFEVPLSFNRGLTSVLQTTEYKLILLFDEFDEPFMQMASRVFLNLRAFKDRYGGSLAYVTATQQPLRRRRLEDHCGEFCELFSHHSWHLAPLTRPDVERFVRDYMAAFEVDFVAADIDFIYSWAGGHPRLLDGVCRILERALENVAQEQAEAAERWQLHKIVARRLLVADELTLECEKIWSKLNQAEQNALSFITVGDSSPREAAPAEATLAGLRRQHLIMKGAGQFQLFCRLFADFVRRKTVAALPNAGQLTLDADRGEVLVDGQPVETLTNLEYRLMTLLFAQQDKIVDKYQIVTSVWGEGYIDAVDDARIEKLVSRVRQKIENDPSSPKFLTTVRGRGYKLVTA